MSKKEIEELLKKGAYGALMDDDKAGEDFCEEDIDKILQSRARVVQLEQGEKNSTFSKVSVIPIHHFNLSLYFTYKLPKLVERFTVIPTPLLVTNLLSSHSFYSFVNALS